MPKSKVKPVAKISSLTTGERLLVLYTFRNMYGYKTSKGMMAKFAERMDDRHWKMLTQVHEIRSIATTVYFMR